MTSAGSLQPDHPSNGLQPADIATWDHDGAIASSEAYRHALWFETGGVPQDEPALGFVPLHNAAPPPARPAAGLRGRRALLLAVAGVAGVASGVLVSGSAGLPDWRPLLEQARVMAASLVPGAAERSSLAAATLSSTAQAETVAVVPRATPAAYAPPPRLAAAEPAVAAAPPPAPSATTRHRPGAELFDTELVQGVVLAAALNEVPAWQDAALPAALPEPAAAPAAELSASPAPPIAPLAEASPPPLVEAPRPPVVELPAPPAVEPLAPAYRVQLATLRYRRNAVPVWEKFVSRLGPLSDRLERYVTTAETVHGQRYLLQVGPFADAPHAGALCERVLQSGGDCVVVPPSS